MYSDISIVAPDSAVAGSVVNLEVRITNLVDYTIYAIPVLDVDGGRNEGNYETIVPGQTRSWYFQFTMPSRSVTVKAESWCESNYFDWHLDDTAQKTISLEEVYAGTISRKELEYDETWGVIPVSNIPQGQRGLLHIWGRNDTGVTQQMGIYWFVADPEGYVVQEYSTWEMWPYTSPGDEHGFLSSRFNLDKVGKYTIWVELLMNQDDPQVVDMYIGDLCTVAAAVPEPQFRGFAIAEYTKR